MACMYPVRLHPHTSDEVVVGCGKCPSCLQRRISTWVNRLEIEQKAHKTTDFFTLTYDDANMPWADAGPSLAKPDLQNFFKRLRKNTNRTTIKYFACGEYGTDKTRPHYHFIGYDTSFEEVERNWGKGLIHQGEANGASMAYVVSYISKPKTFLNSLKENLHPEFSTMSKGLGKNYLTPAMVGYHRTGQNDFITLRGGIRQNLPRYYRDKIWESPERDDLNQTQLLKFRMDLEQRIRDAGSPDIYHQQQTAAIKAASQNYWRHNAEKRNKL